MVLGDSWAYLLTRERGAERTPIQTISLAPCHNICAWQAELNAGNRVSHEPDAGNLARSSRRQGLRHNHIYQGSTQELERELNTFSA